MGSKQLLVETYDAGRLVKTGTVTVETTVEQDNATTISDYLVQRRARLSAIRTQAQAVGAAASFGAGSLSAAVLSNAVRALQADVKTLAAAVDDLAQFDIRLSRRVLDLYDGTD